MSASIKKAIFGVLCLFLVSVVSADPLVLPNLNKNATGTVSTTHNALDVNVVAGGSSASNASVSTTGTSVPLSATFIGGKDGSGNLIGLTVNSSSELLVNSSTLALDATVAETHGTKAAGTAATKSDLMGGVFNTSLPTLTTGQQSAVQFDSSGRLIIAPIQTGANVIGAVTESGTWNITNVSGTVSLPTGASTETTLAAASAKLPATLGQKAMAASMAVALASDQSAIPVSQSGTWNVTNVSGTVSLPTGASTEATLAETHGTKAAGTAATKSQLVGAVFNTSLPGPTNGQQVALQVDSTSRLIMAPLQAGTALIGSASPGGTAPADKARLTYSGTNVTTSAYVQLIASTANAANSMYVFDSSGQTLIIAFGAAASEVDKFYVVPGGNGLVNIAVPASTRVSIKAASATANTGEIDLNLFQ